MSFDADIIFIGSGMGTLAAASILAQMQNKNVLILEKHFKAGGFTHTFQRDGFIFDVGLHYVGQMGEGDQPRMLFDYISAGGVRWNKMPEEFEHYNYPDFTVKVPSSKDAYLELLCSMFPKEKEGLNRYFEDLNKVGAWLSKEMMANMTPKLIGSVLKFFNTQRRETALVTTGEYLDECFKDEKLKAVLTSIWGDYGLPPSLSAFGQHAIVAAHYLKGGYYPVGSAATIASSIEKVLEAHGGKILVNHEVEEILVENGKAVGVKAITGKAESYKEVEFRAPLVISDAGREATLCKLLPDALKLKEEKPRLMPTSAEVLFVGLRDDPSKLGFKGENQWLFSSYDHDRFYLQDKTILDSENTEVYLSFPSLKDPEAKKHTAQIITMTRAENFEKWKDTQWLKRGKDYESLKEKISDRLVEIASRKFPGLEEMIEYRELSTPLTIKSFTSHDYGAIYGAPGTPDEMGERNFLPDTHVENLYLTGSDVVVSGIIGALMGGVSAASQVIGPAGFVQIMAAAKKGSSHNFSTEVATSGAK